MCIRDSIIPFQMAFTSVSFSIVISVPGATSLPVTYTHLVPSGFTSDGVPVTSVLSSAGVSAFATVFVASSDACFPSSCCVALITSFSAKVSPSGTVTSHVPSSLTVASPRTSSPLVTVTVAPLTPVPVIFVAPAFVSSITGVALFSFGATFTRALTAVSYTHLPRRKET